MKSQFVPARSNWLEVAAVVGTGMLHLLFKPLGLQAVFVIVAVCVWLIYIVYRTIQQPAILREWGFRVDNLLKPFLITTAVSLPLIIAMAFLGSLHGTFTLPQHLWILLILYPIWGTIQQFLVQGLVVRNLALTQLGSHPIFLVFLGAILFGMVHATNIRLMLATFCLGLMFVPLYLRFRNLWPLGLFHGWLGSLFYLWVLGHDPWRDLLTTWGWN